MDFTIQWLNDLLGSMEENLDSETLGKVLAKCSGNCTVYWAERAKEIRAKYPNETDMIILLNEFCKILPGGGPKSQ